MSFLNSLLLTLIKALHTFINNYALTIIVFTILIKLVVMPLNLKSRRSTMRMSTIQPKAAALQAKYKDDQEKLNQKLQELYRKEGVSPMGGCLPMIISMFILFAMFYALRTFANEQLVSQFLTFYHNPEIDPHTLVEPFLWIKNLWMPDSPFATYMPDVQSLRLVDYKVWNDVSAKLVADGVIPQALSFAGAADLTTYINDVVTPFISSAAYAPYIAPVAGPRPDPLLHLSGGQRLVPAADPLRRFPDLHAEADHEEQPDGSVSGGQPEDDDLRDDLHVPLLLRQLQLRVRPVLGGFQHLRHRRTDLLQQVL